MDVPKKRPRSVSPDHEARDVPSRSPREAQRSPRCYLLFAGLSQAPCGGLGDLVGTFTSEDTARHAFRDIRLNESSRRSWAQLAVVEGQGVKPLCWFGIGATPAGKPLTYAHLAGGRAMEAEPSRSSSARESVSTRPEGAPTARRGLSNRLTAALTRVRGPLRNHPRPLSERRWQ